MNARIYTGNSPAFSWSPPDIRGARNIQEAVASVTGHLSEDSRRALDALTKAGHEAVFPKPVIQKDNKGRVIEIDFSQNPSPLQRVLLRAVTERSHAYNILGLGVLLKTVAAGLNEYASVEGVKTFWENYKSIQNGLGRLPCNADFLPQGRRLIAGSYLQYAALHGMRVQFKGWDLIPEDGPVLGAALGHQAIMPEFGLCQMDERFMYGADADNFRNNPWSRRVGLPVFLDGVGYPLVYRDRGKLTKEEARRYDQALTTHMIDGMINHGIRPVFYINGTRVPLASNNNGTQAPAGYFSAICDPDKPAHFIQAGISFLGVEVVDRMQQPGVVLVTRTRGAEFVMPNVSNSFPFFRENVYGQTVTHEIIEAVTVPLPNGGKRSVIKAVSRQIEACGQKTFAPLIWEFVESLGKEHGIAILRPRFESLAKQDVLYYRIADLIRSVPPLITADHDFAHLRAGYIRDFIDLILSYLILSQERTVMMRNNLLSKVFETVKLALKHRKEIAA